jgi:hypothetical protein
MTLKTAALLALVGMTLATILVLVGLIVNIMGLMSGVVPALALLTSLVHVFASVSLVVFLYVFHKAQS